MTRYMPVRAGTYQMSSKFGPRGGGMRWGLGFAAPDGTKIYAAQAGSVIHIGAADGFGQWIVNDQPPRQAAERPYTAICGMPMPASRRRTTTCRLRSTDS
jgi:hypothetical protein